MTNDSWQKRAIECVLETKPWKDMPNVTWKHDMERAMKDYQSEQLGR